LLRARYNIAMPKPIKELTPLQYHDLIESCVEGCENRYCLFKIIINELHSSPRLLSQLKNMELHKYFMSQAAKRDVGWDAALEDWVSSGYAFAFSEVYDSEVSPKNLYKDVVAYVKENPQKKA